MLRDNPGRYPFAYLMAGILAIKKGDLLEARDFLSRYLAGPSQGSSWRALARELLQEMDTPRTR